MKVDNIGQPSLGPLRDGTSRATAAKTNAPTGGERVDISPLSASLQKTMTAIAGGSAFDQARVDEIRQAIAEGRFQVDVERVADGLLAHVREMLVASKP